MPSYFFRSSGSLSNLFFNVFSFNFNRTDKKMTSARSVASARSVTSAWSVVLILFFIIDFKGFTVATNYKNHRRWFEKMTGVALILCACRRPPKSMQKAFKNRSKMGPKSIKNQCWKPCKSVFSFGGLLESPKIDFLTIFEPNMAPKGSQNGPQNQ